MIAVELTPRHVVARETWVVIEPMADVVPAPAAVVAVEE
jgi:hypothetical protein